MPHGFAPHPFRALRVAACLALIASALLGVGGTVGGELPACRYDDLATKYTAYRDWRRTLLDPIYAVGPDYAPPDLVLVSEAGLSGEHWVRNVVVDDLRAMANAATAAGVPFVVQSAYRSYQGQVLTFNDWVAQVGEQEALLASARPGHSEHQLGTALDLRSPGGPAPWQLADWATTPEGAWLASHAWEFGFVMSYPPGVSPEITCYKYEPWHYRYVGREMAGALRATGLTLREYLWTVLGNETLTDPPATPTPLLTPTPTPTESASSSPSAAPGSPSVTAAPSVPVPSPSQSDGDGDASLGSDGLIAVVALALAIGASVWGFRAGRRGG